MTNTTPTVLAVGASGKFAGLVVPELAKRGAKVRAFIRDANKSDAVRQKGAAEVAVGDLTDRSSLAAALKDIDAVFYIAPAFIDNEAEVGKTRGCFGIASPASPGCVVGLGKALGDEVAACEVDKRLA